MKSNQGENVARIKKAFSLRRNVLLTFFMLDLTRSLKLNDIFFTILFHLELYENNSVSE